MQFTSKALVVNTRFSIWSFGEADKSGMRTMSRKDKNGEDKPLDFKTCRINFLQEESRMELDDLDGSNASISSSIVDSIEQEK
jgi:hypothetical protein